MALKDWKKIKPHGNLPDASINWTHKGENYDYLSIIPYEKDMSRKIYKWTVETRFTDNKFDTKEKALSFAKRYMKKN